MFLGLSVCPGGCFPADLIGMPPAPACIATVRQQTIPYERYDSLDLHDSTIGYGDRYSHLGTLSSSSRSKTLNRFVLPSKFTHPTDDDDNSDHIIYCRSMKSTSLVLDIHIYLPQCDMC